MKAVIGIALALLIGVAIVAVQFERRAYLCGAGLISLRLPYDLLGESFDGSFWLYDKEGWGVVARLGKLAYADGRVAEVASVNKYKVDHVLLVGVTLDSHNDAIVSIDRPNGAKLRTRLLEPGELRPEDEAGPWIDVSVPNCSRFVEQRSYALFFTAVGMVLLFRFRKSLRRLFFAS